METILPEKLLKLALVAAGNNEKHNYDLNRFLTSAIPVFIECLQWKSACVIRYSRQERTVIWPDNAGDYQTMTIPELLLEDILELSGSAKETGYLKTGLGLFYYFFPFKEDIFLIFSSDSQFPEDGLKLLFPVLGLMAQTCENITRMRDLIQNEGMIKQERNLLRTIIDNIPEPIYVKDLDGRKILLNKAEADLLNADSVEEVQGKTDFDFYPEQVAEKTRREDLEVIRKKTPVIHAEGMVITRAGSEIWLEGNKIPYFDDHGEVLGIIGISHNITNRKKAEKEIQENSDKYQSIFNSFVDLYYKSDLQGNILVLSPSVYDLTGYQPEELIGNKVDAVYEDIGSRNRMIDLLMQGGTINDYENILIRKDGRRVAVSITSHLLCGSNGKPEFIEGSIRDISQRKETEKKLARLLDQQKLITHLATEFINIPLDNSDQAIDRLLSLIGHQNAIDRVYIFSYDFVAGKMSNTHEWCAEGVTPEKEHLQSIPLDSFNLWVETHVKGDMLIVPDVGKLEETDNLKQVLEPQQIKTLITVPMILEGQCLGFVGFDSVKVIKEWSNEEIQFLHLLADLLCNVIDRKRSEHALKTQGAYLKAIFNNVQYQMWLKDVEGKYLLVNQPFIDYFKFSDLNSPINKTANEIWTPEIASRFTSQDKEVLRTRELKIIEEQFEFHGQKVWFEIYRAPILDPAGHLLGTTGIARDITSRIAADKELKMATEEAQAANIAKTRFLANMSHEIRTPLNAIIGMVRLLLESEVTDSQLKLLHNMKTSSETLHSIINDILDFSKIESGQIEIENTDFNLNELFRRVYDAHEYRAEEKGIKLSYSIDDRIYEFLKGDPVHLQQILNNLVSNAIKFTPKGMVELRCEHTGEGNGKQSIFFLVEDTGIGISPENQKKIFNSFQQEDESITRTYGGTGLGLAISKQLAELMGGMLNVESAKNKGSKFYFTIELEEGSSVNHEPDQKLALDATHSLTGVRILLVEDNQFNQFIAQAILEKWDATTELCEDGQQALNKLKTESFDLILMDIQMPVMDGITASTKIRHELKLNTPILALTANVVMGIVERCEQAGMQGYVSKPIDEDELFGKIESALKGINPIAVIHPEPKEQITLSDISRLVKMVGNDETMLNKMLEKFLEVTPEYIRDLSEAFSTRDVEAIQRTSHRVKSAIDLVSNEIVRELIKTINRISRDGEMTQELEEKIQVFLKQFIQLSEELKEKITTN